MSGSQPPKTRALSSLKVAIVHDWLIGGGAERVIYELHKQFPKAPIYTSFCSDEWRKKLDGKVVTGYLQHWPFSKLRKYVGVLRIWWFTRLDFSGYDLVISSSGNGEAKGIRVPAGTVHVCYCHTPTHYYWRHYDQYLRRPGFGIFDPLARLGLKALVGQLRAWDLRASKRPNYYVANSRHIQSDIQRYYGRDSVVIHPPVDTERFSEQQARGKKQQGFVAIGRLVPHRRFDLAVQACAQLGMPLTVIGKGPEYARLRTMAAAIQGGKTTVRFIQDANDETVAAELAAARAFIFSEYADFGITPIESLAAGTPVIAYKAGGALDYLQPGINGEFFEEQTAESLLAVLRTFDPASYNKKAIAKTAQAFSNQRFTVKFTAFLHVVTEKLR